MDKNKWHSLSLPAQMGNIGSELARARKWEEQGAPDEREKSFMRAFELIDLTLSDPKWARRLKELTRLREVVSDWYTQSHVYQISGAEIEDYCVRFSLA